jgi:lysophospholipase L1-like esterase
MRILCLGASITWGVGSTDGNGYRKDLRDILTADGSSVRYVGTQTSGNMENNANEGYPGFRIDQVMGFAWNSYGYWPNIILVHLGTNDFVQGYDPQASANRMGTLVDQIYQAIGSTSPLVVVSKLLPNNRTTTENGILAFNALLDSVVNDRIKQGKNVMLVDMHSSDFSIADLGPDGTHPTDLGYKKMANVWASALKTAVNSNKISAPKNNGVPDKTPNNVACPFTKSSVSHPTTVQFGFGNKTATFVGAWRNSGIVLNHTSPSRVNTFLANLYGGPADDYIAFDNKTKVMKIAQNLGSERFGDFKNFPNRPSCDPASIRFSDMNGDGISDLCCIAKDGSLNAYITSIQNGHPTWPSAPLTRSGSGDFSSGIYIADIDADGNGDFISVSAGGTVRVSYNHGDSWTDFIQVYSIPEFGNSSRYGFAGLQFIDINGDGQYEFVPSKCRR